MAVEFRYWSSDVCSNDWDERVRRALEQPFSIHFGPRQFAPQLEGRLVDWRSPSSEPERPSRIIYTPARNGQPASWSRFLSTRTARSKARLRTSWRKLHQIQWSQSRDCLRRHLPESEPTKSTAGGGEGGIRTHGTRKGTPHFECGTFDHSATSPRGRSTLGRASGFSNGARAAPQAGADDEIASALGGQGRPRASAGRAGRASVTRNSSAGRPPVAADRRPVGSTRPVRSTPRRKFCLCSDRPATASAAACRSDRVKVVGHQVEQDRAVFQLAAQPAQAGGEDAAVVGGHGAAGRRRAGRAVVAVAGGLGDEAGLVEQFVAFEHAAPRSSGRGGRGRTGCRCGPGGAASPAAQAVRASAISAASQAGRPSRRSSHGKMSSTGVQRALGAGRVDGVGGQGEIADRDLAAALGARAWRGGGRGPRRRRCRAVRRSRGGSRSGR